MYGFYDECQRKYGSGNVWRYCCEVFDYLALGAVVDGRVFCVHGGLSPNLATVDQASRLLHGRPFILPITDICGPKQYYCIVRNVFRLQLLTSLTTDSCYRSQTGGPSRWANVRFALVRPRRYAFPPHYEPTFPITVVKYLSINLGIPDIKEWGLSPRGAGFLFGSDVTKKFAYDNGIDLIARAHQLAMEGFKLMFDRTIVTVWSAPNYCYR